MAKRILVTGATGTLGRLLVPRLVAAGASVRALSRQTHEPTEGVQWVTGDLRSGLGIGAAVAGMEVIVHCASAQRGDEESTRHLVNAATAAGLTPHLVYVSIVGVNGVPMFYYKAKLAAEAIVTASGLPWTILRATQFYDLILRGARPLARLPVVPVPVGFRVRPVDADDVARVLAGLALGDPRGRVPDLCGPREFSFAELIRSYLAYTGHPRRVVEVPLPGLRTVRAGGLIPVGEFTVGEATWEQFLARRGVSPG
jgi:uncharacterized protein YbjT (DUF2867 family)